MSSIAVLETKIIQTPNDPQSIQTANDHHARFFWNVKSVQITHVKDSHLEFETYGYVYEVKSVTETTQYATITYERNAQLPLYNDLKRLESLIQDSDDEISAHKKVIANIKSHKGILWYFLTFYPVIALVSVLEMVFSLIGLSLLGSVLGIVLGILYIRYRYRRIKGNQEYEDELRAVLNNELLPKRERLEHEVDQLHAKILELL